MADKFIDVEILQDVPSTFQADIRCTCICGKLVLIGKPQNDGKRTLLHMMPFCDDFLQLSPADFLQKVREHFTSMYPDN